MESNHILSKSQCGFRRGLSTIDVLLRLEHIIKSSLLNRDTCVAVYLDLSSAFDRVHHMGLLSKLAGAGLRGNILAWIRNYLLNRKAFVRVGDVYTMEAGFPQGHLISIALQHHA